jgi:AraC-like DNA-binding protein
LAEIAIELKRALEERDRLGGGGSTHSRVLARGAGWRVADVVCTCGPDDRAYEEQHTEAAAAFVVAGMFELRGSNGRALLTPGAMMLGNPGEHFECSHAHRRGDRCISFWYSEQYLDRVLRDVRGSSVPPNFVVNAVPAISDTAALGAQVVRAVQLGDAAWDELAASTAARSLQVSRRALWTPSSVSRRTESRIADSVHLIESAPDAAPSLDVLAQHAAMSPYHFLRVFTAVSGVTPHQYVRRARLRRASARLLTEQSRIIDIALDSGFGDVSNFNRAFRAEFGSSPREFRAKA